jgi:hypothetical protein
VNTTAAFRLFGDARLTAAAVTRVQRLLALPGDLWLDISDDDTDNS